MGFVKELIVDGIVSTAVDTLERLKGRYPLKKAKLHSALAVLAVVAAPLISLIMAGHGCLLLWDIFEPFSIGVPLFLHLVPVVLQIGIWGFSAFLVLQVWDILSLFYQPIDELMEKGLEELIKPVRNHLLKLDLMLLAIFMLVFGMITVHGVAWSYTAVHFVIQAASVLVCALLLALSTLVYLAVRAALSLIFKRALKHLDERYDISKRIRRFYEPLKRKAPQ